MNFLIKKNIYKLYKTTDSGGRFRVLLKYKQIVKFNVIEVVKIILNVIMTIYYFFIRKGFLHIARNLFFTQLFSFLIGMTVPHPVHPAVCFNIYRSSDLGFIMAHIQKTNE